MLHILKDILSNKGQEQLDQTNEQNVSIITLSQSMCIPKPLL